MQTRQFMLLCYACSGSFLNFFKKKSHVWLWQHDVLSESFCDAKFFIPFDFIAFFNLEKCKFKVLTTTKRLVKYLHFKNCLVNI